MERGKRMKYSRETLKKKYKAGEITIKEFKNGLKEIEEEDKESRNNIWIFH